MTWLLSLAADWGWIAGPVGLIGSFFARSKTWLILGAVVALGITIAWGWVALGSRAERIDTLTAQVGQEKTWRLSAEAETRRTAEIAANNAAELRRHLEHEELRRAAAAAREASLESINQRLSDDLKRVRNAPNRDAALPPALDAVHDILLDRARARAAGAGDGRGGADGVRPAGAPRPAAAAAPAGGEGRRPARRPRPRPG